MKSIKKLDQEIRVVHCFRLPKGGVFRHVCDLVRGQAARGLSVGIICGSSFDDEFADQMLEALESVCSLGILRLPISRTLAVSDLSSAKKMSAMLKEVQPDLIHGHGAKGGAYARLLGARLGIKSVYTPHGGSLHYAASSLSGFIFLNLEKLLKSKTEGLIFESEFSAGTYQAKLGLLPCERKVIHNGLSEDEFDRWTNGNAEYDFVFIGELRKLKGVDTLLDAVAHLKGLRKIKVLIAGSGPDQDYFKTRIDALNLKSKIDVSPPIFPATEGFKRGRCIVVPSLAESFPYIVLEALAAGIPTISTNVGGIPEIFGSYKDDLLEPGNVSQLVEAMSAQMDDPDKALHHSTELKEYVRSHFSLAQMQEQVIAYYQHILAS